MRRSVPRWSSSGGSGGGSPPSGSTTGASKTAGGAVGVAPTPRSGRSRVVLLLLAAPIPVFYYAYENSPEWRSQVETYLPGFREYVRDYSQGAKVDLGILPASDGKTVGATATGSIGETATQLWERITSSLSGFSVNKPVIDGGSSSVSSHETSMSSSVTTQDGSGKSSQSSLNASQGEQNIASGLSGANSTPAGALVSESTSKSSPSGAMSDQTGVLADDGTSKSSLSGATSTQTGALASDSTGESGLGGASPTQGGFVASDSTDKSSLSEASSIQGGIAASDGAITSSLSEAIPTQGGIEGADSANKSGLSGASSTQGGVVASDDASKSSAQRNLNAAGQEISGGKIQSTTASGGASSGMKTAGYTGSSSTGTVSGGIDENEAPTAVARLREGMQNISKRIRAGLFGSDEAIDEPLALSQVEIDVSEEEELKLAVDNARERVEKLRFELHNSAKWEAIRLEELLRATELEERKKLGKETAQRRQESEKLIQNKLEEQKAAIAAEMEDLIQSGVEKQMAKSEASLRGEMDRKLRVYAKEQVQQWKETVRRLEEEDLQLRDEAHKERKEKLEDLKSRAHLASQAAQDFAKFDKSSAAAAEVIGNMMSLATASSSGKSFVVPEGSQPSDSETGSIIEAFKEKGVPTIPQLQRSFERVSNDGFTAAMIPEERELTAFTWMLASIGSKLKIRSVEGISSSSTEVIFTRAQRKMLQGKLKEALSELEQLQGLPKELCEEWMTMARGRLAMDKVVQSAEAEAYHVNQQVI